MTFASSKPNLLTLYKASAGSGKTFMLAVRYIGLLLKKPDCYKNILAVTFTNKATREMKQRILGQLYGISRSIKESDVYLNEIKKVIGNDLPDDILRRNAKIALDYLLQDYGHFRVETIDSFFQTILRNLAKELQLGANQSLELDTNMVIQEAVDSFLSKLKPDSFEIKLIIRFIEEKIQDDHNWKISGEIKSFAEQLFREIFIEKGESLRKILKNPDKVMEFKRMITERRNKELSELSKGIIEANNQMIGVLNNYGIDSSKLDKNAYSLITNMQSEEYFKKALKQKTILNCMNDPSKFFNSAVRKNQPSLIDLAADYLQAPLKRAYDIGNDYIQKDNSYSASLEFLYQLSLLLDIRKEIDLQNAEQERFVLADTCNLLSKLEEGDTSFVFEKTGSFTKHIMIDEFQDTSRLQWQNLRILLLECLAQGEESLVVGDVKQSIYRWRNSDWNILNTEIEKELKTFSPQIINLTTNRRSYFNIIEFNNRFFPALQQVIMQLCVENIGNEFPSLGIAYADVKQESPSDKREGYVKVAMHHLDSEDDPTQYMVMQVAQQVIDLCNAGVKPNDITILTRGKREISAIATYFSVNHPEYKMISNEAFRLDASDSVRILIDALYYIDDESDMVSLTELMMLWNNSVLGKGLNFESIKISDTQSLLPEGFVQSRDSLRQIPLYELVERLYNLFQLQDYQGQDDYVFTFLDLVESYLKNNKSSISDFLLYWKDKLCTTTIPSVATDGIRLMTIHKSKGLEFHTVILPFCNWNMIHTDSRNPEQLWVEPEMEPFNEMPLLPIKFDSKLKDSVFSDSYNNEFGRQMVDNMNLLYVAFTRAKCNLIVLGQRIKKASNTEIDVSIISCLQNNDYFIQNSESDSDVIYINGDIVPHRESFKKISENPFEQIPETGIVKMRSFGIRAEFQQSNESEKFVHSLSDSDTYDDERQNDYIETGKMLHLLFSTINTTADIDREVEKLLLQGVIESSKRASDIKNLIHRSIKNPLVAEWFSGKYKLYKETSILFRNGSKGRGTVQSRRPDRVMMDDNETVVVDFKFGKAKEEHLHQVQEYMDLLKKMGKKNVQGFLWYVYDNKVIECR